MTPECELDIQLKYSECLKCEDRDNCPVNVIDFWEDYRVKKYHRKIKENGILNLKKKGSEKQ
jgi:hypothetical protein